MTELALSTGRLIAQTVDWRVNRNAWRLLLPFLLLLCLTSSPEIRELTIRSLSDAYLQVTVFVAGTLAIVYFLEWRYSIDIGDVLDRSANWQPVVAALLGATPGCGGAIIVVTQYTRGYATFGSLVSVLVATMGDAAFLLIAREPTTALLVITLSVVVGSITGVIVDRIHGPDFLSRQAERTCPPFIPGSIAERNFIGFHKSARKIWLVLLGPGLILGIMTAFQIDADVWLGDIGGLGASRVFGVIGALLAVTMWACSRTSNTQLGYCPYTASEVTTGERIVRDTNFVTAWVVLAFLGYELAIYAIGADISTWFMTWAPLMPVIALLVGFIPGCGPQIVVTTLYLAGAIPLSAQLTNSIANDGDALFPAIALAPRAALVATLYSAVPALIVGYAWLFMFEGF